ncbi:MAG: ribose ABC transporter permease [Thaumarchaeota archaeon]|nr:ribose ABC transporter permease [Nitrososphaerota archaeon]
MEVESVVILRLIAAFTTTYLVALGHSVLERSGVLNLAIDGVFFLATGITVAIVAPLADFLSSLGFTPVLSATLAIIITGLLTAVIGAFKAWILTKLPISHGAVGLSLMFLGYGLGIIAGYTMRLQIVRVGLYAYPDDPSIYLVVLLVAISAGVALHLVITRTALGAAIRACGENPHVALVLGVNVLKVRLTAGVIGFFVMGVGASLFVLLWQKYWDMRIYLLGYGWLAFTIALAAGRHPLVLIPLALVFGGLVEFDVKLQATLGLQRDLAKMIPFLATLALMAVYGSTRLKKVFEPPRSLGKIFYTEERTV